MLPGVFIVRADVTDMDSLNAAFGGADIVVNCAGIYRSSHSVRVVLSLVWHPPSQLLCKGGGCQIKEIILA
jgi:NAD(P)-dependent dehydrogenase (short-subunit alcohol dehydrogenase family)